MKVHLRQPWDRKVYKLVKLGVLTDKAVARECGLSKSQVTYRRYQKFGYSTRDARNGQSPWIRNICRSLDRLIGDSKRMREEIAAAEEKQQRMRRKK